MFIGGKPIRKTQVQLSTGGINLTWFAHVQLKAQFEKRVKHVRGSRNESEIKLCKYDKHVNTRIYKLLLKYDAEQVTECNIRWMLNFGDNIDMNISIQEANLDQLRPTFTWNCLKYTYHSIWISTTWGYISAAGEDDAGTKYWGCGTCPCNPSLFWPDLSWHEQIPI